jgi:hypothetical protein
MTNDGLKMTDVGESLVGSRKTGGDPAGGISQSSTSPSPTGKNKKGFLLKESLFKYTQIISY